MKLSFNFEDASQIFVGSFALAVPISFSEEAWKLGETLPTANLLLLFLLFSLAFIRMRVSFKKTLLLGYRCLFSE